MKPKFTGGAIAPDFTASTLSGSSFQLSDLQGKYVLLDFWGTWCGPCLQEIPELKKLHLKYKDTSFKNANGLEIVSIALEKEGSEARWRKAIERKGLNWTYHVFDPVSNFKFLDAPIASTIYGVKEVPTKYFIDPAGQVIGVNLPFEEIYNTLEQEKK